MKALQATLYSTRELWLGAAALLALALTSLYSYLLFHSFAELFSIAVAGSLFLLAWNTRRFFENGYLFFISLAFLFIGGLDLVHTLAFKGMGVFPGDSANQPTQLWIAARYLQSIAFLLAPLFIGRRIQARYVLSTWGVVTALVLASIFYWRNFPDCYIEGVGLTPFKKVSEGIISLLLLAALYLLWRRRQAFDPQVWQLLVLSMCASILSELVFTAYISVYDWANLTGHLLKIVAFYLLYKATVQIGLLAPYKVMFRDLQQSEQALRTANERLEERVAERTAALSEANEHLRQELEARQRAEAALRESEMKYRIVADNTHAWEFWVDPSGCFVYSSPSCKSLTGYGPEEFIADPDLILRLIHPDDVAAFKEHSARRAECTTTELEFRLIRADGQICWVQHVCQPVLSADGQYLGTRGSNRDITTRKNNEAEIRRLNEELEQRVVERTAQLAATNTELEKAIEQRDQFFNVASHELRTPLTSMMGYAELLQQRAQKHPDLDELDRRAIRIIQEQTERLNKLISALLDVSRIEAGRLRLELEPMSLAGLVRRVTSELEPGVEEHPLEVMVPNDSLVIDGDELRLEQVLHNLIQNAVKYSPRGGPVTVCVERRGEWACVAVGDHGIGIPESALPKLFNRFYRAPNAEQMHLMGMGIGLYVVKEIVSLHGGKVEVESQEARGSTFTVYLPLTSAGESMT